MKRSVLALYSKSLFRSSLLLPVDFPSVMAVIPPRLVQGARTPNVPRVKFKPINTPPFRNISPSYVGLQTFFCYSGLSLVRTMRVLLRRLSLFKAYRPERMENNQYQGESGMDSRHPRAYRRTRIRLDVLLKHILNPVLVTAAS